MHKSIILFLSLISLISCIGKSGDGSKIDRNPYDMECEPLNVYGIDRKEYELVVTIDSDIKIPNSMDVFYICDFNDGSAAIITASDFNGDGIIKIKIKQYYAHLVRLSAALDFDGNGNFFGDPKTYWDGKGGIPAVPHPENHSKLDADLRDPRAKEKIHFRVPWLGPRASG